MIDYSTREGRAEYRRQYREQMRRNGYRRLDIQLPPKLWAKLRPILEDYGGDTHPGSALLAWLEDEFRGT